MLDDRHPVPLIWSRTSGFCSSTGYGTSLVDLRQADPVALASGQALAALAEQLEAVGRHAKLRVWMVPGPVLKVWNETDERFATVLSRISDASVDAVANATILCGGADLDPAMLWLLRSCGHSIFVAPAAAPPPVMEVRLGAEVIAGVYGVEELR